MEYFLSLIPSQMSSDGLYLEVLIQFSNNRVQGMLLDYSYLGFEVDLKFDRELKILTFVKCWVPASP